MPTLGHDLEKGLKSLPFGEFPHGTSQQSSSATLVGPKEVPALTFPHKSKLRTSRTIKFQLWFNTYRKLFTFVVTLNLVGLLLAATSTWQYPRRYSGAMVLGNLQMAILMRNELFGRFLYLFVNTLFAKWTPLWFRLACTSLLQHLGGIHSGCAISGVAWLVFRIALLAIDFQQYHPSILATGVVTAFALTVSIASALPWVREAHHNIFEGYHRLVGWIGLVSSTQCLYLTRRALNFFQLGFLSFWAIHTAFETHSWNPNGMRDVHQQDFWFVIVMTVLTLLPWVTLRRVPVPSPKAVIIRFERGMQQGLLARISRGSMFEFHAFGIISKGRQSGEHYIICGVQGDFTQSLVENPPTHLWTRQLKPTSSRAYPNTSRLYKRGIRICTGTGLGAALSTCLQSPDCIRFGIQKKRGGRPDVMELIRETYVSWGAEVVFITSNLGGNTEMMEGCKREGIPAFGTLWDF
ncbi:hypothetical protein C8F01DRAFT_1243674 [Mycena amicta]|nr:hypothetical protein C8F01DRAFT_1243674 [Mycena amicta]